jgi:hypothetical protein
MDGAVREKVGVGSECNRSCCEGNTDGTQLKALMTKGNLKAIHHHLEAVQRFKITHACEKTWTT